MSARVTKGPRTKGEGGRCWKGAGEWDKGGKGANDQY